MDAAERTLRQILTEKIRHETAASHRAYLSENVNVEKLIDDVWEVDEANDAEYFNDPLFVIERDKDRVYDIVDGQQRPDTLNRKEAQTCRD